MPSSFPPQQRTFKAQGLTPSSRFSHHSRWNIVNTELLRAQIFQVVRLFLKGSTATKGGRETSSRRSFTIPVTTFQQSEQSVTQDDRTAVISTLNIPREVNVASLCVQPSYCIAALVRVTAVLGEIGHDASAWPTIFVTRSEVGEPLNISRFRSSLPFSYPSRKLWVFSLPVVRFGEAHLAVHCIAAQCLVPRPTGNLRPCGSTLPRSCDYSVCGATLLGCPPAPLFRDV